VFTFSPSTVQASFDGTLVYLALVVCYIPVSAVSAPIIIYDGFGPDDTFYPYGFTSIGKVSYDSEDADAHKAFGFQLRNLNDPVIARIDFGVRTYFNYGFDGLDVSIYPHDPSRPPWHPNAAAGGPEFHRPLFYENVMLAGGSEIISVKPNLPAEPHKWYWVVLSLNEPLPKSLVGWHAGLTPLNEQQHEPYYFGEYYIGPPVPGGEQCGNFREFRGQFT
jgi:hypothetical protein